MLFVISLTSVSLETWPIKAKLPDRLSFYCTCDVYVLVKY